MQIKIKTNRKQPKNQIKIHRDGAAACNVAISALAAAYRSTFQRRHSVCVCLNADQLHWDPFASCSQYGGRLFDNLVQGAGSATDHTVHMDTKSKKLLEIAMNVNEQENGINNKNHVDCNYLYICKLLAAI